MTAVRNTVAAPEMVGALEALRSTSSHTRQALAQADELAGKGRFLDAIDVLTQANRRERDTEIEVRLVRLRNAAFAELDRTTRDSPWPDDTPRPRTGDEPLPGTPVDALTAETVRDSILRYGCAFVPGFISQEEVAQLKAGIDQAFAGLDRYAAGGWYRDTSGDEPAEHAAAAPWYFRFDHPDGEDIRGTRKFVREGAGVWTVESPRVMFDFLEILERVGLHTVISDYLGERPAMTMKKSTLRCVPPLPRADWHQDGAFLGDGIRTINLWLSLSHCGKDAPGLDLVPRRLDRIVETGTGGAFFDWSVGPDTVEEAADGVPVLRPLFEPGDALLFDEMFLHRTATNDSMTENRYAIENWFFAPSVYPGDQIPFVW